LLWTHSSDAISLWTITAPGVYSADNYGPYPNWQAKGIATGGDNLTRILWTNSANSSVSVWTVNSPGNISTQNYGPFPGWTAKTIAVGQDNKIRLAWVNGSGAVSIWTITS